LSYLERKGLAHRDIKPHNILINEDSIVKLCDFGISISLEELKLETTPEKGTELYIPPRRARDIQDDMWALGLTLLEVLDGKNPLASNKYNFTPHISNQISVEMRYCIFYLYVQQMKIVFEFALNVFFYYLDYKRNLKNGQNHMKKF